MTGLMNSKKTIAASVLALVLLLALGMSSRADIREERSNYYKGRGCWTAPGASPRYQPPSIAKF